MFAGWTGTAEVVLAGTEQTEGEGSPDAAEAVDGPGADGVVDAERFEEIHTEDDDDAGNCTEDASIVGLTQ